MQNLTPLVAELAALVGPVVAGKMIAEALIFLADKYTGGDLALLLEGITTTPNGRARFDEVMRWNTQAAKGMVA